MTDQTPPPSDPPQPGEPSPGDSPGTGPTTPMQSAPPGKRFRRSRDDKVIAGVCGGLARYFGIDPVIVRIAAVALLFAGGFSAIAYIAAVLFVPEEGEEPAGGRSVPSRAATILGIAVLVIACFAALDNLTFGWGWGWWAGPVIPIALLCLVLYIGGQRLLERRGEHQPSARRIAGIALLLIAGCIGATILGLAAAWATAAGGGEVVAALVIALGVAMIIASFRGGARWLALPALILALPAGVVSAADIDVRGGVGEHHQRPFAAADLPADGYRLGMGELSIDLRDMRWPTDSPVRLKVEVGVGHAVVYVPQDVCVRAAAEAGIGYIDVLGDDAGGIDLRYDAGATQPRHRPLLILDGDVGMGALEVRHDAVDRGGWDDNHRGGQSISAELRDAGCAGATA